MFSLSSLWNRKPKRSTPSGAAISYIGLQHYFQLFNKKDYTITDNPPNTHEAIKQTGNILKALRKAEQRDFFDGTSQFTDIGTRTNDVGGSISYGFYKRENEQGQKEEYIFITMLTEEPCEETQKQKLFPHFLLLGQIISHRNGLGIHPVVLGSQSHIDEDGNAHFTIADHHCPEHLSVHLSFADLPYRHILSNKTFFAQDIIQDFIKTTPEGHFRKYLHLAEHRTSSSLQIDLQEIKP